MGWVVNATLQTLCTQEDSILTVQEAGWASGLIWKGLENLAPYGI
jgi:hypothetical protein